MEDNLLSKIDIISAFTEDEEISIPDHFSPTSDIADSWKVIKELRYKGIYVTIDSMNCTVTAFVMKEDQTPPYNYRSTLATEQCESIEMNDLPLKICLVALKSLGVNVEGIVT